MNRIAINRAFSLWLPPVAVLPFRDSGDTRIVHVPAGDTAAFQSGNVIGIVGIRKAHRIGRRDA